MTRYGKVSGGTFRLTPREALLTLATIDQGVYASFWIGGSYCYNSGSVLPVFSALTADRTLPCNR